MRFVNRMFEALWFLGLSALPDTANAATPIKPGKSKTFEIPFAPLSPGVKTALLTITSNDVETQQARPVTAENRR